MQARPLFLPTPETGKPFSHELCWMEVKNLPKFCINTDDMTAQMEKALALDEEDEINSSDEGDGVALNDNDKNPGSCNSKRSLKMTPRPAFGKKAAKKLQFSSPKSVSDEKAAFYKRITDNAEQRTAFQKDRFTMSLFAMDPQSEAAKRFLSIKQEEALIEAELNLARKKRELAQLQLEAHHGQ